MSVTACVQLDRVAPEAAELTPQTRESVAGEAAESDETSAQAAPESAEAPVESDETSAQARDILSVTGTNTEQTIACEDHDIVIDGENNAITLTGTCDTLEVTGDNNAVQIEQVAVIEVIGVNNTVTWQNSANGDTPTVTNTGVNNRIGQSEEQEAPATVEGSLEESSVNDLLGGDTGSVSIDLGNLDSLIGQVGNPEDMIIVAGTGDVSTYTCENNSVVVTGAENTVTLEGTCEAIVVAGANNDIFVEAVVSITLAGVENTIIWQNRVDGQPPMVTDAGVNNVIEQGERP